MSKPEATAVRKPPTPSQPEPRAPFVWPRQGEWTYEDWVQLPDDDGWQYEVIRGRLYMCPAPRSRHQIAASHLSYALQRHVHDRESGLVLFAPLDVYLPGEATPVQPDIVVITEDQASILVERGVEGAPALLVEILSPSTRWKDLEIKRPVYAECGVGELWIVDPVEQEILVHVLGEDGWREPLRYGAGERLRSERLAGFSVEVDEIFGA